MSDPRISVEAIVACLSHIKLRAGRELAMQDTIATALAGAGIVFGREVQLAPTNRIDFLVEDVGIEAKVAGGHGEVLRQLHRYAEEERVAGLVLVTTCLRHRRMPHELLGKPLRVVHLFGGSL